MSLQQLGRRGRRPRQARIPYAERIIAPRAKQPRHCEPEGRGNLLETGCGLCVPAGDCHVSLRPPRNDVLFDRLTPASFEAGVIICQISRDTSPEVSAIPGARGRTPREGCPYGNWDVADAVPYKPEFHMQSGN